MSLRLMGLGRSMSMLGLILLSCTRLRRSREVDSVAVKVLYCLRKGLFYLITLFGYLFMGEQTGLFA